MQLLIVAILTVLPTTAYATPMGRTQLARLGCNIAGYVIALAPSAVACAMAASTDGTGINVPADVSCLTTVATVVQNFPASCDNCAEEFGIVNAINSVAGRVVDGVGDAASKIGDAIGSIF